MSESADWGSEDVIGRLRHTRRGWEEVWPDQCAGCRRPLTEIKLLVGVVCCSCGIWHRSYHHDHESCQATTYMPTLGRDCVALALDDRQRRDRNHP